MFLCSEWAPSSCSLRPPSWFIIITSCSSFSASDSGVPEGQEPKTSVSTQQSHDQSHVRSDIRLVWHRKCSNVVLNKQEHHSSELFRPIVSYLNHGCKNSRVHADQVISMNPFIENLNSINTFAVQLEFHTVGRFRHAPVCQQNRPAQDERLSSTWTLWWGVPRNSKHSRAPAGHLDTLQKGVLNFEAKC